MKETCQCVKVGSALTILCFLMLLGLAGSRSLADEIPDDPATAPSGAVSRLLDGDVGSLSYVPGRGLRFGTSGLVLGGYTSVDFTRDEGGPGHLNLEDLSLFVMLQGFERFTFFSELEFEDLLSIDSDGNAGSSGERFEIERLYADFAYSDQLKVRVGKFLTPVGRWNVIHAQPLVWTTSRPLVTELPFDENTTGVSLSGELLSGRIGYDVFGQFTNQLEPTPQFVEADRSGGARLTIQPRPGLSLGSTYLAFRSRDEWFHLGGLDAVWRDGPIEWMSELSFDEGAGTSGSQWGLYSQLAVQFFSQVYGIGRYEHFAPRGAGRSLNQVVVGAAYRPAPYATFKVEYQIVDHHSDLTEAGFRSSLAILF